MEELGEGEIPWIGLQVQVMRLKGIASFAEERTPRICGERTLTKGGVNSQIPAHIFALAS